MDVLNSTDGGLLLLLDLDNTADALPQLEDAQVEEGKEEESMTSRAGEGAAQRVSHPRVCGSRLQRQHPGVGGAVSVPGENEERS